MYLFNVYQQFFISHGLKMEDSVKYFVVITDISFRVQLTSFRIDRRKAETNFLSYTISLEYFWRCQLFLRLSNTMAIT
jgi:hypothetical protein